MTSRGFSDNVDGNTTKSTKRKRVRESGKEAPGLTITVNGILMFCSGCNLGTSQGFLDTEISHTYV
jgi:hypothetical protein